MIFIDGDSIRFFDRGIFGDGGARLIERESGEVGIIIDDKLCDKFVGNCVVDHISRNRIGSELVGVEAFNVHVGVISKKVASTASLGTENFTGERFPDDMTITSRWGGIFGKDDVLDRGIIRGTKINFLGTRRGDSEAGCASVSDFAFGDVIDDDVELDIFDFNGFIKFFSDVIDDFDIHTDDFLVVVKFERSEESIGFDNIVGGGVFLDSKRDSANNNKGKGKEGNKRFDEIF